MPTPPLPVLHALLTALSLPPTVHPSTLASVPPTLLLLVLELLLSHRLPLPSSLRSPRTRNAEIELTKIILGSLADDVLALDLTVVDPVRVIDGSEPDIAVVIMALAVAARRRGVAMRLPSEVGEDECDISWDSMEGRSLLDAQDEAPLKDVEPLEPLRSPVSTAPSSRSPFQTPPRAPARTASQTNGEQDAPTEAIGAVDEPRDYAPSTSTVPISDEWTTGFDPLARTPSPRRTPSPTTSSTWSSSSRARSWRSAGRKTVLQSMIEEFGLSPG